MKKNAVSVLIVAALLSAAALDSAGAGGLAKKPFAAPQLTGLPVSQAVVIAGANGARQLGPSIPGTTTSYNFLAAVNVGGYIRSMAAGSTHVLVALDDGSVQAWGAADTYTGYGGAGTASPDPVTKFYNLFRSVRQVAAGNNASYVLLENGDLYSFGYNNSGQLGQGTVGSGSGTPGRVVGLSGVTYVDAKCESAAAIDNVGRLYVWGSNAGGQLAVGSAGGANGMPTQIGSNVIDVAVGCDFMVALTADGQIWGWGSNWAGQLGTGNTIPRYSPYAVAGLGGAVSVGAGYYHAMAVMADGTLRTWGYNAYGQLGLGNTSTPVLTPSTPSGITTVKYAAGGDYHTVIGIQNKQDDMEVWTAGDNTNGQLAGGTAMPGPRSTFAVATSAYTNSPSLRRTGLVANFASDLFWHNPSTGQTGFWNGSTTAGPTNIFNALPTIPLGYTVFGTADINFDDNTEVFFYNLNSGDVYYWSLMGLGTSAVVVDEARIGTVPPSSGWRPQTVGDFDGDGSADILWRNTATGDVAIWSLDDLGRVIYNQGFGVVGLSWTIVKSGDFNGDGIDDILWRNTSSGDVYMWYGTKVRTLFRQAFLGTVALAWQPQGIVDLDADGRSDIFWRNTSTGQNFIWYMQGAGYIGAFAPTVADLNWNVIAVYGMNSNEPQSAIVWRNSASSEVYWWGFGDRPAGPNATTLQEGALGLASTAWVIGQ